jgi:hypothetical protein
MLDIRTLLLETPEDRYASTPVLRAAERRLYPLLLGVGERPGPPVAIRAATMQEVQG